MKINRFTLAFFLILSIAFFANLSAQTVAPKQLVGKWLFADFSYKSAEYPDQDYTLSRKDFENMIKFKKTMAINEREMKEQYGDMIIDYVYQIEGNILYYWIPASQDGKTVLDDAVRKSTRTTKYNVTFENGKMVWMRQNSAYILKLILQKQ
jgi:hypothetical protein